MRRGAACQLVETAPYCISSAATFSTCALAERTGSEQRCALARSAWAVRRPERMPRLLSTQLAGCLRRSGEADVADPVYPKVALLVLTPVSSPTPQPQPHSPNPNRNPNSDPNPSLGGPQVRTVNKPFSVRANSCAHVHATAASKAAATAADADADANAVTDGRAIRGRRCAWPVTAVAARHSRLGDRRQGYRLVARGGGRLQ